MKKLVILSVATVAVLTFSGCGSSSNDDAAKNTVTETAHKAAEATKEAASKTVEAAKETTTKAVEATKEVAHKTVEAAKETTTKAVEATKEAAHKTVEAAKETADKAVEATKEAATAVADKATETASAGNEKGKAAYAKCVSCHGADGKTKALGKSEIIAGQNAADLEKKMAEYKAGTRNVAGMGTLMKGQVASLSDEDIKAIAEYISNLK